jgi:hypothetical protein
VRYVIYDISRLRVNLVFVMRFLRIWTRGSRSRWPLDIRCGCVAARSLGLWV